MRRIGAFRMTKARAFSCGLLLLLVSAWPLGAEERLTMRVSPTYSFAPANLVVRTTVVADPDNRAIEVAAESPDFYRSSRIQLDGDRAPRISLFEFRGLPGGTYQVSAVLIGAGGERTGAHRQVIVNGDNDRD